MRFRKNSQEENCITPNISGVIEKRFEKIYKQGMGEMEIWVDKETGVNYLYHASGYAGGLTVLLDKDGKPVITPIEEMDS